MPIPGNLLTTAMAVMPHRNVDRALEMSLSLDVPFWPQLPLLDYHEDMYVQASEHFPGITVDFENRKVRFSMDRFIIEIDETLARFDEPDYFDVSEKFSAVYHRFLDIDLSQKPAIRGQLEGPISLGFNVLDQDDRPILFNDTVRPFMLEFMAKRVNIQLKRLKERNDNAFIYIDEPGLQFIFSALSGYNDRTAREDLESFFSQVERPRGVHLCGNPDWDFLLNLDMDILSLDVFKNGDIFVNYDSAIQRFLDKGAVLCWGIVPTNVEPFELETIDSLQKRLVALWKALEGKGIDQEQLISQSLISPATCCLINPDGEQTVEKAFAVLNELSSRLRDSYVQ